MNGKPAILRLWKRREAKLALLGLVLVVVTQWSFLLLNPKGGVTLGFVGIVTQGRNLETGALAEFRLRNESHGEITYFGERAQEPDCEVQSVVGQAEVEVGLAGYISNPGMATAVGGSPFTLAAGEEVTVYARVWKANGPWRLGMAYQEDKTVWWLRLIPQSYHGWFITQKALGPECKVVSEVVDARVRGLGSKQRFTLMQYRMLVETTCNGKPQFILVTNANGSFELDLVQRTKEVQDEVK